LAASGHNGERWRTHRRLDHRPSACVGTDVGSRLRSSTENVLDRKHIMWSPRGPATSGMAARCAGLTFRAKSEMLAGEEKQVFMPDLADVLGASKAASALLVLFIPSKDRRNKPIDQRYWVKESLNVLGTLFGGATAFPRGDGIWRDDAQGGELLFDNPVVIHCYTTEHLIEQKMPVLRDFLHRMGREARQGAIGLVVNDDYLEIGFPLEEATAPKQRRSKKRR
jgi:hypothetical protein